MTIVLAFEIGFLAGFVFTCYWLASKRIVRPPFVVEYVVIVVDEIGREVSRRKLESMSEGAQN
jgi:uncharacterized protein YneF (UPF0154 family)